MRLRVQSAVLISWSILAFYGCTNFPLSDTRFNVFGARELVEPDKFESINLIDLLAEHGKVDPGRKPVDVDEAFRAFYDKPADRELRRNRVQERILAASAQRCAAYTRFLKQFDSESGFLLGALTTALAGAGAIVTPAATARALAGIAGITSGVNAEFTEKFFSRLTIQVLTRAIDVRRQTIYSNIAKNQNKKIDEYPVEAAVKDALAYHGACSLLAGLEEAAASIERAQDPGLAHLNELTEKNPLFRRLIFGDQTAIVRALKDTNALRDDLDKLEKLIEDTKGTDAAKQQPVQGLLEQAQKTLEAKKKDYGQGLAEVLKLTQELEKASKTDDVLRLTGQLSYQQDRARQISREVAKQTEVLRGATAKK